MDKRIISYGRNAQNIGLYPIGHDLTLSAKTPNKSRHKKK
jgi:hypothetical protein